MKIIFKLFVISCFIFPVKVFAATTNYVSLAGAHIPPFDSWFNAATNIQAAVDIASPGDVVLVAPGVYDFGERLVSGDVTPNRLVITNAIKVVSVDGAEHTIIQGSQSISKGVGVGAVRCIYLRNGAELQGFTIRNGGTLDSNPCVWAPLSGGGVNAVNSTVADSHIVNNIAVYGGGVSGGIYVRCRIRDNTATHSGGGAASAELIQCEVINNAAFLDGGGMSYGKAKASLLLQNIAGGEGGGAYSASLRNCSVIQNYAADAGGGIHGGAAYNSIIYHNNSRKQPNHDGGADFGAFITFSCTTPANFRVGNIDVPPDLVGVGQVAFSSSCRAAGGELLAPTWLSPSEPSFLDINGGEFANPPSIGSDEPSGNLIGPLSLEILCYTNVVVRHTTTFTGIVRGKALRSVWDFADGTLENNRAVTSHSWSEGGNYEVTFTAYNETFPDGLSTSVWVKVHDLAEYFVISNHSDAAYPFDSWGNAAATIQDAVEVASLIHGSTIWVAPGIYDTGGRVPSQYTTIPSRICVEAPITIRSTDGAAQTIIKGEPGLSGGNGFGAIRAAFICNGATLKDLTIRDGFTDIIPICDGGALYSYVVSDTVGGGVFGPGGTLINCIVTANSANGGGGGIYMTTALGCLIFGNYLPLEESDGSFSIGGGAHKSTIYHSLIVSNSANWAGGVSMSELFGCRIEHNLAEWGGGAGYSELTNCIVANNHATLSTGGIDGGVVKHCTVVGNTSQQYPGGIESALTENSIVYYNSPGDFDWGHSMTFSCTSVAFFGEGLITAEPLFRDKFAGDYRLKPNSPCIDSGLSQLQHLESQDIGGNPRLLIAGVDMGAHEFAFDVEINAKLQGALDISTGVMTKHPAIPLTSPYAADPRTVAAIPTNAVDWALFELRTSTNAAPVFSRSVLLDHEGRLMTESGETTIPIAVTPMSDYHVSVKHRTHLASVTASPVAFTNVFISVDFTGSHTNYLGGTNVTVQVGSVWAARVGDLDGDGIIGGLDESLLTTQFGASGYLRGDINFDGVVDAADLVFTNNLARGLTGNFMTTVLNPNLRVFPDRKTLVSGEQLPLAVQDVGSATIHWSYAANPSGSTLSDSIGSSVTYTAGSTPGVVDVVQAWDASNRVGRTYLNVISPDEVAALGKAIVLAGGRSLDDPVWPATEYLAEKAYGILRYRGFSRDNLQYLTFQPGPKDLDGDGIANDIDGASTHIEAEHAFTTFAQGANALVVYMVDHGATAGGLGRFRLNGSELLDAATVDGWLDAYQDSSGKDVIVILDFCYAGAFAAELDYDGPAKRTVISATQPGQLTYFIAGGQVSFSEYFWNGVLQGMDVMEAFALAADAMNGYQQGMIEDGQGGASAQTQRIGASFIAGKDFPVISRFLDGMALAGTSRAILWVESIASFYDIDRVWCTITPPNYTDNPLTGQPVIDIPLRELSFNQISQRWEFKYDGFTENGPYLINFFARDIWGSVSPPRTTTVVQRGFDERLILVAAGESTDSNWPDIQLIAHQALAAYEKRLLGTNEVYFLSANTFDDFASPGINRVNALSTSANIEAAIAEWASTADKLTLHIVGNANHNGEASLANGEWLDYQVLATWLSRYQIGDRNVIVVLDHFGAGGQLNLLKAPRGKERIVVASTEANRPSVLLPGHSFTSLLSSGIVSGHSLGMAADRARKTLRRTSGDLRQKGLLDDNGNGIANEKDLDGKIAAARYIGSAFVTGEDNPVIATVMPELTLTNTTHAVLWVEGVTDADGIAAVWVDITPPTNDITRLTHRLDLENIGTRWEVDYPGFVREGSYTLSFQAMDVFTNLSEVVQSRVMVLNPSEPTRLAPELADLYEPDDDCMTAAIHDLPVVQIHSLHVASDVDTVRFWARSDLVYDIETIHLDTTIDTVIEIHRELPDGSFVLVDRVDEFGFNEGELAGLDFPEEGLYCVRVSHADGSPFEPGAYVLIIHVPVGFTGINVTARNIATQGALAGAVAKLYTPGGSLLNSAVVDSSGVVKFEQPVGDYRVEVEPPPGYVALFDPSRSFNVPENPNSTYGNARNLPSSGFGTVSYGPDAGSTAAYLGYYFFPGVSVTGSVVSAMTHEPLDDAAFSLRRTSDNALFDRYPWASYGSLWRSTDGHFPARMFVPPSASLEMTISLPGFTNGLFSITTPSTGPLDLGRVLLGFVDSDNDGLPDVWEMEAAGTLTHDGQNVLPGWESTLWERFVSNIGPATPGGALRLSGPATPGEAFTLRWPASPSRRYKIHTAPTPAGPWTEAADLISPVVQDGHASWTDSAPTSPRFYLVEALFLP